MSEPRVSVVVVPRERFSFALPSLDRLLAVPTLPHRLLYVDAGSPRSVRRGIERRAARHGFEVLRSDRYLSPNAARNLALPRLRTEYVVFLDNDTLVAPGWLEGLVRCADETGAWACGPLYIEGPPEEQRIHMAGGDCRFVEEDGERHFFETHHHSTERADAVRPALARHPTDFVEFHCMLVRRDVFERLGPLDEELLSLFEHSDLCLQIRLAGGSVWLEPAVRVAWMPPGLRLTDAPYFAMRWSEEWGQRSARRFAERWGLAPDDPGLRPTLEFSRFHRRRLFGRSRRLAGRLLGPGAGWLRRTLLVPGERGVRRLVLRATQARSAGAGEPPPPSA